MKTLIFYQLPKSCITKQLKQFFQLRNLTVKVNVSIKSCICFLFFANNATLKLNRLISKKYFQAYKKLYENNLPYPQPNHHHKKYRQSDTTQRTPLINSVHILHKLLRKALQFIINRMLLTMERKFPVTH